MARSYKRDSSGRFAGGGGGGSGVRKSGGSKAATSRAANTARAAQLKAAGTTAIGGRVKAKGFMGGQSAQQRAGGLRKQGRASIKATGTGVGAGTRAGMKANAIAISKERSRAAAKQGAKKTAKMRKAPVSEAKARYKELAGRARKASPYATAGENRQAAGAKRSLAAMQKNRGRAAAPKKRPILDALARPILRAVQGRTGRKR